MKILGLFLFWIVLSQKFDAFHLILGLVSAVAIAIYSRRVLELPGRSAHVPLLPSRRISIIKTSRYLFWLLKEIAVANIHIAYVVLHPKLPIKPQVLKLETKLPHELAQAFLANSITLTPGTVTLDVEKDEFLVHALTDVSASSLRASEDSPTSMVRRIKDLFGGAGR